MNSCVGLLLLIVFISVRVNAADNSGDNATAEKEWGVAVGLRAAKIPFATDEDVVKDIVPQLYYEGDYLYLRGEYGGLRFYQQQKYNVNVMGRFRYFDVPAQYQNWLQGSSIDLGLQFEYHLTQQVPYQLELLSDSDGKAYLNNHLRYNLDVGNWDIHARASLRLKSVGFNNRYYGLEQVDIGGDYDITVGAKVRYHVYQNFYLLGEANLTRLGQKTVHSDLIASPTQGELFLGMGIFNDKKRLALPQLPDNHYLRWAFGWATPSNISEIIRFNSEKDEYNNRMSSLFYGLPLSDELFSFPISIYLTPGFVYHLRSQVQDPLTEYVIALKAYYTFTWPVRWRFGVAEGLSYVSSITYIEGFELDRKDYEPSKLLNYLDFSLDLNLGDLFSYPPMKKVWLGYSIHHRSGIFESNSSFGRIKGGSNYNTIYLQWHW